jgi:predicted  nucleic acid-binding Zn-ribbon protein
MSNQTRFIIFTIIIIVSMAIGAVAVAAYNQPSERELSFIRYGEVRQAMNQLHAENETDRKRMEERGTKWEKLNQESIQLESKLF